MSDYTQYRLTAERGKRSASIDFEETSDEGAILHSVFMVLFRASKDPLWARGEIKLLNLNSKEVIKTMDAKEES